MEVTVLGAGSWGTALALVLARNGHAVRLLGRPGPDWEALACARENRRYLPGFPLPENVSLAEFGDARPHGELVIVAVPSSAVQAVLSAVRGYPVIVIASKGLAPDGTGVLSDLMEREVPEAHAVALSGPNLALELARGIPTAAVAASLHTDAAERVREAFMCRTYRVYLSDDVRGVELAGALKNVLAIGAGMTDGLGYGDNTKGVLLARGLSEIARLGVAMGARLETFLGIAGVGDLFATAASRLSRNHRVGFAMGEGRSLEEALSALGQVAEGVTTVRIALPMARRLGVETPLMDAIGAVLAGQTGPREALTRLMERAPRREDAFAPGPRPS